MHILIISSKFPYPLKDGGAIATYSLAKGISECGNHVFIFSFNTRKHFIDKSSIPAEAFSGMMFDFVEIDTKLNYLKALLNLLFSRMPYILQRFKSQKYSDQLLNLLSKSEFDIVQVEGLYMMQYLDLIKKHSKALVVYRPHNLEHRIWELLSQNAANWLKKVYFKILSQRIFRFEKSILNKYDIILPISPFDAAFFEKLGNSKTLAVVPAGFKTSNYIPKTQFDLRHKIFYVGSLDWIPNQEGVIWFIDNCWEKLRQNFPNLELHIAGRNTPKWLISGYSKPGIYWAGEVEEIQDFIKDKTIMIVPLFSGSGMRVKIIEAFLSYKAVVASGIAVQGTGGEDNCELLIADGHIEFISKICHLINNDKLYKRLITDAYSFACINFDNSQISSELHDLYKQSLQ